MTFSQEIIKDLQDELNSKKNQKEALLSQLSLLDVRIDKYDSLISNIDKDALIPIDIINTKVNALKQAYDARITANCRSNLGWVLVEEWEPSYYRGSVVSSSIYYKYEVQKVGKSSTPYRGLKYYQKPLNRDYGANIITTFTGTISVGSTVLTILDNNSQVSLLSQVGDLVVDNLDNPAVFSKSNLPSIVGFGTTQVVGIVTTLVGGISTGSTIFAHYGPGISTIGIDTGMLFECVGVVTSTVVGFGTTTFPVQFLNEDGFYETSQVPCDSVILNSPAVNGVIEAVFTVGIVTSASSILLSTEAVGSATSTLFTVIRQGDIDTNFDYRQNPFDPLNIGIINSSTTGVGHSISLDISGNPAETQTWSSNSSYFDTSTNTQVNPEPLVGAGKAEYYEGTFSWPGITTCNNLGICSIRRVPEGTVAITTGSIETTALATTSVGPAIIGSKSCSQLDSDINTAIADLNTAISQYQSQIEPLINTTRALRQDRDRKELQAWSILQALGSVTEEIQRLETDINSLVNTNFSPYESS